MVLLLVYFLTLTTLRCYGAALPILAKAALIAGGLVLAGVAVKAAADKVRDEGFFGMGGTGGQSLVLHMIS